MLTPATRASRTSAPPVIIAKAVSTQVLLPPFLNLLPLLDETTTGLTLFGVIIVGDCPKSVEGIAAAAAVVWTNSRRFSFLLMSRSSMWTLVRRRRAVNRLNRHHPWFVSA